MKSKSVQTKKLIRAACVLMALSLPMTAQNEPARHHHYKLIDMGLKSYINGFDY